MRNVVLYIAMSLDGYIAKPDGDIHWLSIVEKEDEDYGYKKFTDTVDTVIMGRKTYEKVLSFGIEFPHKDKKVYVISNTQTGSDANVEFIGGDLKDFIHALKKTTGKNIFIDGGAVLVNTMLKENLIDEIIISIIPVMLGKGIRLFGEIDNEHKLILLSSGKFDSMLVQLHYQIDI